MHSPFVPRLSSVGIIYLHNEESKEDEDDDESYDNDDYYLYDSDMIISDEYDAYDDNYDVIAAVSGGRRDEVCSEEALQAIPGATLPPLETEYVGLHLWHVS